VYHCTDFTVARRAVTGFFLSISFVMPRRGGVKQWCTSDVCLFDVCRVHRA